MFIPLSATSSRLTTSETTIHVHKVMDMSYQCSKCSSDMEEGFLLEMGDFNTLSSQTWVAGTLEKSFFSGLSLKGKVVYDVKTFRCIACGYLDSYALQKQ